MTVACGVWSAYLPPVKLPGTWKRCCTMAAAPSPAEMNRRHREFWDVESQVFERRLADPQLVAAATEDMNSEILRRVPIYSRPWNWPLRMPRNAGPRSEAETGARAVDPGGATRFRG